MLSHQPAAAAGWMPVAGSKRLSCFSHLLPQGVGMPSGGHLAFGEGVYSSFWRYSCQGLSSPLSKGVQGSPVCVLFINAICDRLSVLQTQN